MIEHAKATHEEVRFRNDSLVLFHDNAINHAYSTHWHEVMEIIMPIDGPFTVTHNGVMYRLASGEVLFILPNVPHAVPSSGTRRYICLGSLLPLCSQKLYDAIRRLLPPIIHVSPSKDALLHAEIRILFEGIAQETRNPGMTSELSIYAKLLQMLAMLTKQAAVRESVTDGRDGTDGVRDNRIASVCDYIHLHYMEKLTLDALAQANGFSKYHFERLFKRHTGETFYQHLNGVRIKNAAMLLADNSLSITDIAYKTGFPSISAFIRMFHIQYQCTPSAYRRICRNVQMETSSSQSEWSVAQGKATGETASHAQDWDYRLHLRRKRKNS